MTPDACSATPGAFRFPPNATKNRGLLGQFAGFYTSPSIRLEHPTTKIRVGAAAGVFEMETYAVSGTVPKRKQLSHDACPLRPALEPRRIDGFQTIQTLRTVIGTIRMSAHRQDSLASK